MTYRENGVQLMRGVTLKELFLYWGGDERGSDFAVPRKDFPICITIAAHATHAVGVAYAMKLRREPRVAVCALGDGATSKGDFYEGSNAAALEAAGVRRNIPVGDLGAAPRAEREPNYWPKADRRRIRGRQVMANDVTRFARDGSGACKGSRRRRPKLHAARRPSERPHDGGAAKRYRSNEEWPRQEARTPRGGSYLAASSVGKSKTGMRAQECKRGTGRGEAFPTRRIPHRVHVDPFTRRYPPRSRASGCCA